MLLIQELRMEYLNYENVVFQNWRSKKEDLGQNIEDIEDKESVIDFDIIDNIVIDDYKELQNVSKVTHMLMEIGWISFIEEACNAILYHQIKNKISQCKNMFTSQYVEKAIK
jgi:hypothetical protein